MSATSSATSSRRPVVVEHSFGDPGSGGPVGALERILASRLTESYDFVRMHQQSANGGLDVRRLRAWTRLLRETRPDLVHVRGLGNEGFHGVLAARLARCPRVLVTVHGTARDLIGPTPVKRRVIVRLLEPATLRLATHVSTVCHFAARRDFVDRHAAKLVGPLVNGVEIEPAAPAEERAATRAELGLAPGRVALISVGRLTYDKGHLHLAEALSRLPGPTREALVLVLVGDGPDAESIRDRYRDCGVEDRFLGRRNDVVRLLGAADVFVFPTLHENLSNALLEAMSQGLPVIATDVGGNTEVLAGGGSVLVGPGDPAALSSAILRLARNPELRAELGREARAIVESRYSLEVMCRTLDRTYRQVLAG